MSMTSDQQYSSSVFILASCLAHYSAIARTKVASLAENRGLPQVPMIFEAPAGRIPPAEGPFVAVDRDRRTELERVRQTWPSLQ